MAKTYNENTMQTDYQKLKAYYRCYYNKNECLRYLLNNMNNRIKLVTHGRFYYYADNVGFIADRAHGKYFGLNFCEYDHRKIRNEYCNYTMETNQYLHDSCDFNGCTFEERDMIHLHQTVFRFYPHYLEYEKTGKCEIYTNDFKYETNKFDVFDIDERLFNILNTFAYFDFLTIMHVEVFIISFDANSIKINKTLLKAVTTFYKTTDIFNDSVLIKSFFAEFVAYFRSMPPNYELFVGVPYYDFFLHAFLAKHVLMWMCEVEQENYVDSLTTRVIANDYLMQHVCNFIIETETRN